MTLKELMGTGLKVTHHQILATTPTPGWVGMEAVGKGWDLESLGGRERQGEPGGGKGCRGHC